MVYSLVEIKSDKKVVKIMHKYRRNNKKFIMMIAIVAVVIAIILLATILLPNTAKEKEYQKGLEAIQNMDYATAESIFSGLAQEDYKDSFFVNALMQYRLEFESVKEKTAIVSDYDTAMADIDRYSEIFNNVGETDNDIISADVSSAKNEITQLKNDIEEKQQKEKEEQEQFLQQIIDEVNNGQKTYGMAISELTKKYHIRELEFAYVKNSIRALVNSGTGEPIPEDIRSLYFYFSYKIGKEVINAEIERYKDADLKFFKDKDVTMETVLEFRDMYSSGKEDNFSKNERKMELIAAISPDYQGINAEEIVNVGIEYFGSKEEWQAKHNAYIEQEAKLLDAPVQKVKPFR